jgi:cytochrome P450
MVNAWAKMRDPEYWQNAENFIPEILNSNTTLDFIGTNFTYMPFRVGKRMLMMS